MMRISIIILQYVFLNIFVQFKFWPTWWNLNYLFLWFSLQRIELFLFCFRGKISWLLEFSVMSVIFWNLWIVETCDFVWKIFELCLEIEKRRIQKYVIKVIWEYIRNEKDLFFFRFFQHVRKKSCCSWMCFNIDVSFTLIRTEILFLFVF